MRISDWSSDVCSPDLAAPENHGLPLFYRGMVPKLFYTRCGTRSATGRASKASERARGQPWKRCPVHAEGTSETFSGDSKSHSRQDSRHREDRYRKNKIGRAHV